MRFAVYLPPQALQGPVPVLVYLAGLTCTEETFTIKAGAQRVAAELGLALVRPTPARAAPTCRARRQLGLRRGRRLLPGCHAGPWATHWRMESYCWRAAAAGGRNFPVLQRPPASSAIRWAGTAR
jgi:S-formylglutathione hydrolase